MEISTIGLDDTIKDLVRSDIKDALLKKYRTLPTSTQVEMVEVTLTEEVMGKLRERIVEYYKEVIEHDIICNIDRKGFMDIYFHRA